MGANTALVSKVAAWTKAGLTASYAHKQDDSQKLDWRVKTVFHTAGYSVNTMTGTVQPRVDCKDPSEAKANYDIGDTEPMFIDYSGEQMKPRVKLVSRAEVIASRFAENVQKQLDSEESTDITARGGFNRNTVDNHDGMLHQAGDVAAAHVAYKWAPRRSRSERMRRFSYADDSGVEASVPSKRRRN